MTLMTSQKLGKNMKIQWHEWHHEVCSDYPHEIRDDGREFTFNGREFTFNELGKILEEVSNCVRLINFEGRGIKDSYDDVRQKFNAVSEILAKLGDRDEET